MFRKIQDLDRDSSQGTAFLLVVVAESCAFGRPYLGFGETLAEMAKRGPLSAALRKNSKRGQLSFWSFNFSKFVLEMDEILTARCN